VHHAHQPVAVVRDATHHAGRRAVVVGVDGSAGGQRALAWGVEEARRRNAPLEVVHAWTFTVMGTPWGPTIDPGLAQFEADAHRLVADQLASVDTTDLTSPVRARIVQGAAGQVLVEFAERAQLIVVGARGIGGLHELLLGSVSQHVSHHASCPTIVVRPSEEAP
jgi:nucleotide-binding universal stress UspA family protein